MMVPKQVADDLLNELDKKNHEIAELKAYLTETNMQLEYRDSLLNYWLHEARFFVANIPEANAFRDTVENVLGE